ncbi:MAG TPA: cytochrome P460 family protein [Bryobacteraceae bacterium]|jgi:hypothetical protein
MNKYALATVFAAAAALYGQTGQVSSAPQFTKDGKLVLPKDYREWVFLSSGLGMTYGTPEAARQQNFDNVFVHPAAYRAFVQTGHWPDRTIFILETRAASGKGSINQGGHFQSDLIGLAAEVKDRAHAPEGEWAYYGFGTKAQTAPVLPKTAPCYVCHSQNTAVENTFVQFYPTLLPIARAKGTIKPTYKE